MKELGANAIRVYHVNAADNHDGCMAAFADAGIYLFVDADSFHTYVRMGTEASWTQDKSKSYREVVDAFQQYPNTAGFFIGNEVLNILDDQDAAPYLLTAAVDLKAHIAEQGYRKIPIGYSATDTAVLRPMLQYYLVCRPNVTERLDFYALNSYEWCGQSQNYNTSGYFALQEEAENYPVPIFFSEDGCNTVPPRTFNDQAAIFSEPMVSTWSGAMIYEWIEELNHYGVVSYGPPLDPSVQDGDRVIQGFTRQGVPTPLQPDFGNLQQQWKDVNPTGVRLSDYAATVSTSPPSCPTSTAGGWVIDGYAPLPTMASGAVSAVVPSGSSGTSRPSSTQENSSSATSEGSAPRALGPSPSVHGYGILGMTTALVGLGAAVIVWL
ncbi:hypothetical protein, variant 1 [Exophiala mesophila]|nr:hypothetical protein, variant 1 [Exophiala mesophila]KIV97639.1 hypothetical protein, variant 1 [Exophiala mesophila]